MRKTVTLLAALLMSCGSPKSASDPKITELTKDLADARTRIEKLEKDLLETRKTQIAELDILKQLNSRLGTVEVRLLIPPPATVTERTAESPAPSPRSYAAAPSAPSAAPREFASDPQQNRPPAKHYDSDVAAYCKSEWPSNYAMQESCSDRQQAAKDGLARASQPFGMPFPVWLEIKQHCAAEWPGNYSMQESCRSRQVAAHTAITPR